MEQPPTSVLILFGGESPEHDVSIRSAKNVYHALDKNRYHVHLGYIDRAGTTWALVPSFANLEGPTLTPQLGTRSFLVEDRTIDVDVLLPILHGAHGEDGDVQGLANLLHLPCVGPNVLGAALTMDKDLTKRVVRDAGIPVVDWRLWKTRNPVPSYEAMSEKLGHTMFVKPSTAGSSVGVSKVTNEHTYLDALHLAATHSDSVLIERAIVGREIELAVLGNDDGAVATPGEVISGSDFYSYDVKYAASSQARTEIPARLSSAVTEQLCAYAKTAYVATRGQGMARIDFFVTDKNEIFLNEINTIPGFTDISMFPKMWEYDGLLYPELLQRLIDLALHQGR